jgi:hypothetical protein
MIAWIWGWPRKGIIPLGIIEIPEHQKQSNEQNPSQIKASINQTRIIKRSNSRKNREPKNKEIAF